jgi:hypothetical protein
LVIGPPDLREQFCQDLTDLTGLTPAFLHVLAAQLDQVADQK